jgi:hypothetical protein
MIPERWSAQLHETESFQTKVFYAILQSYHVLNGTAATALPLLTLDVCQLPDADGPIH